MPFPRNTVRDWCTSAAWQLSIRNRHTCDNSNDNYCVTLLIIVLFITRLRGLVSSPHQIPLPVTSASPQDDDDSLDTDGFQEQFLLETPPPPPIEDTLRRTKEETTGTKTTTTSIHRRTSSDVTVVQLEERRELASAEESELGEEEDLTETVSTRSEVTTDIEEASDTRTSVDLSDSELKMRPDQLGIFSSVKSPEEEKGAKDSKRAENIKYQEEIGRRIAFHPVERLSGGVGVGKEVPKKDKLDKEEETYDADSEPQEGECKKQYESGKEEEGNGKSRGAGDDGKHIDRGTSPLEGKALSSPNPPDSSPLPAPGSRTNQPPPTLELVIGRKEVRTKEASATAESRLTLYGARDVEISIRSQSHISVTTTRREASGRETSERVDVGMTATAGTGSTAGRVPRAELSPEVTEEPVGERRDVYIIPPPSSDQTEPQQTELTKEKKREETVIFSGKKSVYRYESLEAAGTPAFESPTTEESASHHITDTGISLTRGTTTDTITSPAQRPPGEIYIDDRGVLSDTAVDVGAEEAELTDAGLSPIQADDVGLGLPSTELMFLEEEIVLAHYCDTASSPVEFQQVETTSVALSPLQIETSEASVSTDKVDTRDASVSPIRPEGSSPPAQDRADDEIVRARRDSGDVRALIRLLEEGAQQRMQPVPSKEPKKAKDEPLFIRTVDLREDKDTRIPKEERIELVKEYKVPDRIQDTVETVEQETKLYKPASVPTTPKHIGPKIKQLQRIFTQSTESEPEDIIEKRVPSPKHKISLDEPYFLKEEVKPKERITVEEEEKDTYPHMSQVIETIEKRIATEGQQTKPASLKYVSTEMEFEEKSKPSLVEERLTQLVKAEEQVLKKIEEVITFVEESSNRKEFLAYLEQSEEMTREEIRTDHKLDTQFGLTEDDIYVKEKHDEEYTRIRDEESRPKSLTLEEHIEHEKQQLIERSKREIEIEETEQIAKEIAELKQLLPFTQKESSQKKEKISIEEIRDWETSDITQQKISERQLQKGIEVGISEMQHDTLADYVEYDEEEPIAKDEWGEHIISEIKEDVPAENVEIEIPFIKKEHIPRAAAVADLKEEMPTEEIQMPSEVEKLLDEVEVSEEDVEKITAVSITDDGELQESPTETLAVEKEIEETKITTAAKKQVVTEEVISEKVEKGLLVERPAMKEDKEEEVKEEAKEVVVEEPLAAKEIEHEVESVPS
ncbi:hypothetical protein C0J52_26734, partial [Blattella germanica]